MRRLLCHLPLPALRLFAGRSKTALDAAYWSGIRRAVSRGQWRRLTKSSYVAVYYHRIAGQLLEGQERLDLRPRTLARQMRLLRLLRFRPLSPETIVAFHRGEIDTLPRRAVVVTADDGFVDSLDELGRYPWAHPIVFIPTAVLGQAPTWTGAGEVASEDAVRAAAEAGVWFGSHSRHHASLTDLSADALDDELAGSLEELQALGLPRSTTLLAYPHGRHNEAVRDAARRAGYHAAFATEAGANGAGSDLYSLARVGVKDWDSALSFLWKVTTGELLPAWWERFRLKVWRSARRRAR